MRDSLTWEQGTILGPDVRVDLSQDQRLLICREIGDYHYGDARVVIPVIHQPSERQVISLLRLLGVRKK